ncbi:MAG: hypothetical protein K0Q95_2308 [Bacteroidota bacterium]|jgi:hypothetical protein|nr:hypothetical protein [Bacteroidota bacterium]
MRFKEIFSVCISAITLWPLSALAQSPGYLGKHVTLGYSNNFFPALIGPVAKSYNKGLNSTHGLNFEYTIKNRTNFCFSFQRFRTGVNINHTFIQSKVDSFGNTRNTTYNFDSKEPLLLQTNGLCFGFKFFDPGVLAPVGKYRKFELVLLFSKLTYGGKSFIIFDNYTNANPIKGKIGTGEYKFNSFALTYSLGRQRVLFDLLVLDYGIQFGVVPAALVATLNMESDYSSLSTLESVLRQETNRRLFRYETINLHIGLGFLAF